MESQELTTKKVVRVLKEGGVVIFPTDTVWGIGASIEQLGAIKRLYQIKRREKEKPTAILVDSLARAKHYGQFNKQAEKLARQYWPGGLTLVVKVKQDQVPKIVRGKGGTVGLRVPDNNLVRKFLEALGAGIVAASANFAGQRAPTTREVIDQKLIDLVDLVVEAEEESKGSRASSVVDVTGKKMKLIRAGAVKLRL